MIATVLRNRRVACELASMLVVTAVLAAAAACVANADAALWCAASGVTCALLFAAFTARRHAEIARLTAEIDDVLLVGRSVDFTSCREGDVEALRCELGKVVARLARTTEQLTQEKRALADAMADISHQIRTPLTAMALMLPAFEHADDARERKRLVREVETLSDRVAWLVTSLLKMAKADAGALTVEHAPVSVGDVVARATSPLEAALDLRGVRLEVDCPDAVSFKGDARWSAEALENIVKNCMEHTPAGGRVSVRASEDALATRIVVEDAGAGIAPEDLPHVFERFYRGTHGAARGVAPGTTRGAGHGTAPESAPESAFGAAPEGFGVGLSLALALVSAQGGTLRASNAPHGGARFEMTFPKLVV
ncbi:MULTISPECIES: sensor histidine kinase KdpD [unclassified Adlercreutzia]|uniref:sensor histidine kinase n=1 Tax=unclassified Adlercreutzia TaxID=2636013 RepID=UPI0013EA9C19|nr:MULTISPECIES: HAMP domain-containing sensor histidine kinase [unclassified Adlercreutzia]